jgi:hypothetical protein
MTRRSDKYWLIIALGFGVLVLPWLVFATGRTLLGPYADGSALMFFVNFLLDLVTFHWHAWAMALGPLLIVVVFVGLWRLAAPQGETTSPVVTTSSRQEPTLRREPTLHRSPRSESDPYSSDAGYSKPRPWGRVDRD